MGLPKVMKWFKVDYRLNEIMSDKDRTFIDLTWRIDRMVEKVNRSYLGENGLGIVETVDAGEETSLGEDGEIDSEITDAGSDAGLGL